MCHQDSSQQRNAHRRIRKEIAICRTVTLIFQCDFFIFIKNIGSFQCWLKTDVFFG